MEAEDPETQASILDSLREERKVRDRLRAALPRLDFPETGGDVELGAQYEVDYVEQPHPPGQIEVATVTISDGSGEVGAMQGTVEGAPALEVLGSTAALDGVPRTELIPPALCPNSDRCHQVANLAGGLEHCCERCFRANAVEHSGDCRWWHNTCSGTKESSLEATLNDIKPAPMDF